MNKNTDRWQFDGGDGETYIVEAEGIRDDTIVRIKRRNGGTTVETHRWSGSLLAQALLALVEEPAEGEESDDDDEPVDDEALILGERDHPHAY
jgi:hypothetical protein